METTSIGWFLRVVGARIGLCFLVAASSAEAQEAARVRIAGMPKCTECRVALTRVTRLGSESDSILLTFSSGVALTSRGLFVVGPTAERGKIAVFDGGGRLVRTVGRRGMGPGEFDRIIRVAILPGDSILVVERTGRFTILAPSFEFARGGTMPRLRQIAVWPDGRMIVGGQISSSAGIGYPLHLLAPTGMVIRSFGVTSPAYRADRPDLLSRAIGASRTGDHFWAGLNHRYEIERWDLEGQKRMSIVREVSWFGSWDGMAPGNPAEAKPPPRLLQVREDGAGRLWTRLALADVNWKADSSALGSVGSLSRLPEFLDAVIEVIDPQSGTVAASTRFPDLLPVFIEESDLAYSLTDDSRGYVSADVWRMTVLPDLPGR